MTRPPYDLTTIIGSAALGALAMFLLDPDKGKRRRAIARDKALSLIDDSRDAAGVAARDATHRIQGAQARVRRLFRRGPVPDDLQLIERVRARMGRLVSHPHAIQVGAHDGRITLSGPILAREAQRLVHAIGNVWGVSEVENRLVVHEHPESVSSLQGGVARADIAHEHWTPALRLAALAGGAALAFYGMRRRSLTGSAIAGAGLALAARGATNVPLAHLADVATGRRTIVPRAASEAADVPEPSAEAKAPEAADPDEEARPALH
jgi:hypothetical protein